MMSPNAPRDDGVPPTPDESPRNTSPSDPGDGADADMRAHSDAPRDVPVSRALTGLEELADQARARRDRFTPDSEHAIPPAAGRARRRQTRPAAEGERNAVVGYLGQYEFAAGRTLAALREGALRAVRVADVSAGQIDDFQLQATDRVDAHQVKWSLHPGSVGFAEFVRDAEDRTRFIRQLADGWERLTAIHRPSRVVVHFVTNNLPSTGTSRTIPRPDAPVDSTEEVRSWSFAAFVAEAWRPAIEAARAGVDPNGAVPLPWHPAMAALERASGLTPESWRAFLADCELEFGVPSLEATTAAAPISEAERAVLRRDANQLAHTYMQLIARPDRRVEFSRDQLLDELGWRFRVEFRNPHEFPDPEIPYRSIAATTREVSEAVGRYTSGYVAVIGSPGSGKSTLLTRTLRESTERVIRYYAYVRGAVGGSLRRGEAVNFFHDLTIALDRVGLHAGSTLPVDDLDLLTRRVHVQLAQAHVEWATGGRRTIILVDGLDHIPREQRPTQSLLSHLPHPEDVPDGVLFVLGTQTDRLQGISPRIREHLDEPGRRITMRPLDRRDVVDIVESADDLVPAPTAAERERIFDLSGGHPLALNYIVNRLRHSPGVNVAETLDLVEPFRAGIDRQYASIWGEVEDDIELAHLLALLARARGPVRLDWMRQWAPRQALHTTTTRLAYLFRQEYGGRWTFFHNSFRAFLIERTRDLPALGSDAELFLEFAEHCSSAQAREPENADELYYRARASDIERVLVLADPERFRVQFVGGRSTAIIRDDLSLALDAAIDAKNIVALTQILLCSAEFSQREHYAELLPIAETWLELGDVDLALGALREGASLRTSRAAALRAAAALDERGFTAEAHEVFTLAEPLDVLRGSHERTGRSQDDMDILDAWIGVAPRFRSVTMITTMIQNLRASADEFRVMDENDRAAEDAAETEGRQYRLLQGLAIALDRLDRWDDADAVRATLRTNQEAVSWWFWAQSIAWHDALAAGQQTRAERQFGEIREGIDSGDILESDLGPEASVALAGGYLRVACDIDAARRIADRVQQPAPIDATSWVNDVWRPFQLRFALNRVLGALGDDRPLDVIVPDVSPGSAGRPKGWDEGVALVTKFERGVAHLGRLAGRVWVGDALAPSEFEVHARSLVRLFPDHPHSAHGAYIVTRARGEFYTRLVHAAATHGAGCLEILQCLFDAEWYDDARRDAWPESLVRTILTKLLAAGVSAEWVRTHLARVEPLKFSGDDLETDLPEAVAQARAWISVGDIVAARATFERAMRAAFGIEAKEGQLNPLLAWAVRANDEDPVRSAERLAQMAAAVVAAEGIDGEGYASTTLLEAGVAAGARPALSLVEWSLRNDVDGWVSALTTLIGEFAARAPAAAGTLSACYRSVVLPYRTAAGVDTVAKLADALRRAGETRELQALGAAVDVVALASTRPALRLAVAGQPEDAAESLRDETVTDPTAPGHLVDAFDGLSLTLRQLQERVQSVADVQDLAGRLKPNAYLYRWELILSRFVARATADELVAIADAIPRNEYAWKVLAMIADRLLGLGDARAGVVIERVLRDSRAAGWWARFDGGSRLSAYELLVRISPEEGRRAAWQTLRDDLISGEVRRIDVFRSWDRIVGILAPETSAVDIWQVVSRHVAALIAYAPTGEPLISPPAEDPGDHVAVVKTLCDFIAGYLDHPAYALAQGAQQFFTDRLLAGDGLAEDVLTGRLTDDVARKDGALLVLHAFALARGEIPASMHAPLRALLGAPYYPDRRRAAALLLTVGNDPTAAGATSPTLIHPPLPGVFQLVHPDAPPPRQYAVLPRGAMLEPAEDAADLVGLFRSEVDLIAHWADVQPEALYQWVAERAMSGIAGANLHDFAFDDEPALRDEMSRLGLQITYRRPRPRRVERAMGEAVAMLVDHGRLSDRYWPALDRIFRNFDPFFVVARPQARPGVVMPILERGSAKYVRDGWTSEVTVNDAVAGSVVWMGAYQGQIGVAPEILQTSKPTDASAAGPVAEEEGDPWIILAEETWLRWLDWDQPTETRVGARLEPKVWRRQGSDEDDVTDEEDSDGDIKAGEVLGDHVAVFSHLTADEYISKARAPYSIVVRNHTYRFETPGGSWLALNPVLAGYLGWRPAPDGLFRWLDAGGTLVAESVWWQDGFTEQRPPQFDDEVGSGWLVRVTLSGWREMAAVLGECVDWCRVERIARDQPRAGVVGWAPVL